MSDLLEFSTFENTFDYLVITGDIIKGLNMMDTIKCSDFPPSFSKVWFLKIQGIDHFIRDCEICYYSDNGTQDFSNFLSELEKSNYGDNYVIMKKYEIHCNKQSKYDFVDAYNILNTIKEESRFSFSFGGFTIVTLSTGARIISLLGEN